MHGHFENTWLGSTELPWRRSFRKLLYLNRNDLVNKRLGWVASNDLWCSATNPNLFPRHKLIARRPSSLPSFPSPGGIYFFFLALSLGNFKLDTLHKARRTSPLSTFRVATLSCPKLSTQSQFYFVHTSIWWWLKPSFSRSSLQSLARPPLVQSTKRIKLSNGKSIVVLLKYLLICYFRDVRVV